MDIKPKILPTYVGKAIISLKITDMKSKTLPTYAGKATIAL